MMKQKKEIDLLTKTLISKLSNRSRKFKSLVETTNICVVYENEKKIKKTDCKDKDYLNEMKVGVVLGKHIALAQTFDIGCVCRQKSIFDYKTKTDNFHQRVLVENTSQELWATFSGQLPQFLKMLSM